MQPSGATAVTNNQGEFKIPDIAPGAQKLMVSFVGFSTFTGDITISAGQTSRQEITLQVGSQTEEVW